MIDFCSPLHLLYTTHHSTPHILMFKKYLLVEWMELCLVPDELINIFMFVSLSFSFLHGEGVPQQEASRSSISWWLQDMACHSLSIGAFSHVDPAAVCSLCLCSPCPPESGDKSDKSWFMLGISRVPCVAFLSLLTDEIDLVKKMFPQLVPFMKGRETQNTFYHLPTISRLAHPSYSN